MSCNGEKALFYPILALLLISAMSAHASEPRLKIAEPSREEILYGWTKIVVNVDPDIRDEVSRIDYYLGTYPNLICSDHEYPFECEVNVGEQLQGWEIKAKAFDRQGALIDETSISTRSFPRPTRVSKYILANIPVRAYDEDDTAMQSPSEKNIACRFGESECTILSVRKVSDLLEGEEGVIAYLDIVIDLSESMNASTDREREGLEGIADLLPKNTQVRFSVFSDFKSLTTLTFSNNEGFTSNRKNIENAIEKIRWSEGKTCLFSNLEKLIDAQPPYKIIRRILLITDCVDTCDELASRDKVIEHARELADVIDIYRTNNYKGTNPEVFKCEALAVATGGEIFDGESVALPDAVKEVIAGISESYLFDIGLADDAKEKKMEKLLLSPSKKTIRLKYPAGHRAGVMDELSLAMLRAENPIVKIRALKKLGYSDNPEIIGKIIETYQEEKDERVRVQQRATICDLIGASLLHSEDTKSKKAALKAIQSLHSMDPSLMGSLEPFLKVFQKKEQNRKLRMKAATFVDRN